jgi:hypothetical protein
MDRHRSLADFSTITSGLEIAELAKQLGDGDTMPEALAAITSGLDIVAIQVRLADMFDKNAGCLSCCITALAWTSKPLENEVWQKEVIEEKKPFICSNRCYMALVADESIVADGSLRPPPQLVRTVARIFVQQEEDISNWMTWKNGCYGCEHECPGQRDHYGGCLGNSADDEYY